MLPKLYVCAQVLSGFEIVSCLKTRVLSIFSYAKQLLDSDFSSFFGTQLCQAEHISQV
jgi:hypothetical protein